MQNQPGQLTKAECLKAMAVTLIVGFGLLFLVWVIINPPSNLLPTGSPSPPPTKSPTEIRLELEDLERDVRSLQRDVRSLQIEILK